MTNRNPSIKTKIDKKLNSRGAPIAKLGKEEEPNHILIVGSAPTIGAHIKRIRSFKGERWALNDSWFWLEEKGIPPDRAFITDTRFIKKSIHKIRNSSCKNLVVIDSVDLTAVKSLDKSLLILKCLGRDGFSIRSGEVFHGCSVFFTALQTAFNLGYKKISVCGVLFSPPGKYVRIDGSVSMPEYVFQIQLNNARHSLQTLRKFNISLSIFEPESNLNFF